MYNQFAFKFNVIIVNNNDFRKYQFIQLHGHGDAINYFLLIYMHYSILTFKCSPYMETLEHWRHYYISYYFYILTKN